MEEPDSLDERVIRRSAGSDTPGNGRLDKLAVEQAEVILEESDERSMDRDAAPDSFVEHRRSEDTVPPVD